MKRPAGGDQRLAVSKRGFGAPRSAFGKALGCAVALGMLGSAGTVPAQTGGSAQGVGQGAQVPNALVPYTSCVFPDGLRIVETSPLAAGVQSRPVQTATGMHSIDLVAGERVLLAYPMTDYFANVKAELLPADRYASLKQSLIDNLHFLEAQKGGPSPAEALPAGLHGFEVHGDDRPKLEGNVLGMYLLFDDRAHVATTVDFLNQHAWERKFQTMDEYGRLRDNFLRAYTGCVRQNEALER